MATVHPKVTFEPNEIKYDRDGTMEMNNVTPVTDPDLTPEPPSYREAEIAPEISLELTIFQCARNGDLDQLQCILDSKSTDINDPDDESLTPLHYAARYNHHEVVVLLLEHGALVQAEDDEGLTPLHYACRIKRRRKKGKKSMYDLYGDPNREESQDQIDVGIMKKLSPFKSREKSVIKALLDKQANIRKKDNYGLTALHHAALRGDEVACEILLSFDQTLVHTVDLQMMTPLHTAACQGEMDIVRQLINAGANIFARDEEMSIPLHEAATIGDSRSAKIIFDSCRDDAQKTARLMKEVDEDGNNVLMLAVESGKYKFAVMCIKKGASLNTKNKSQMTALHLAAINGDVRIVRLLLESRANVAALNSEHQTPLHKAALFNNTEVIDVLLQNGADIEARDRDDFTPLLIAACYGHDKSIEMLIDRQADITVKDKNDRSAIYLAAEENKLSALQVLLKNSKVKEMINDKDENSNSALHIAATLGHVSIVKCLLDNGADLYSKNDMEATPIHCAAQHGWTNCVKEIVKREKNAMSDGDEQSNTALHLAAMGGHTKLVEALLLLGAGTSVRNSTLRTPLGCAAHEGYIKTVKILANHDAEIDPIDKQRMTPLLLAAENGHADVVDFLIEHNANVTNCDKSGYNCLELAINNDHTEVALEVIKSKAWKYALRNMEQLDRWRIDTPLRKLIRKMPEIAEKVFDKCIKVNKPEEGSQPKLTDKYEVVYDFEFLDDLYHVPKWNKDTKPHHSDKEKENDEVMIAYTEESEVFKSNHPVMVMVNSSREELLAHPLVHALMRLKWTSFGRVFYYATFGTYLVFLFFLTGYVIATKPPYQIDRDSLAAFGGGDDCQRYESSGAKQHVFATIAKYFILILSFLNIIKEAFQAFHGKLAYITIENFLECGLFISAILFTLDFEPCQNATGYRFDWQWYFGTIAVFMAWIELILFIQKFPELGIYVVMFKYILYTFLKFALVFLLFIIAFGMGFYCLIQNQTLALGASHRVYLNVVVYNPAFIYIWLLSKPLISCFDILFAYLCRKYCPFKQTPYRNVWLAIIRTAVMMIGEFDYNDIFHGEDEVHYWLTYVFMCVFVVIMSIIIMNLLVGLAVDDIKGVQEQAQLKRIAMKVSLTLDIERISLKFTSRYFKKKHSVFFKTADEAEEETSPKKEIDSQIKASQEKVLKKVDKIKTTVKTLKKDMLKIEEMLEAIMRHQDIRTDQDEL